MDMMGRRILITGAASGIGLATARMLTENGAQVGLIDRDATRLAQVAADLNAPVAAANVSMEREVKTAVSHLAKRLQGLDGLVNCAGIDLVKRFADMTSQEWNDVMGVNLDGPFHVCKAALPHLQRASAATIVNVASAAGLRPLEQRTAYCASKGGLVMFTKTLAADLAADGIRANVVCPGIVETPLFFASYANAPDPAAELARIKDRYCIKRPATPDEIAAAILFLTSHNSSYITGTALAVDGGRSFH